jgi:hypothetical protein
MVYVKKNSASNINHLLKLKITIIVPYINNPGFVGRADILEKLKDYLGYGR